MDVQVKLVKLQGAVAGALQRLETAEKNAAENPKRDKDFWYRQQVDAAKNILFDAENELAAFETQVEVAKGTHEEKIKKNNEEVGDITVGLQEYFGADKFEEMTIRYGDPLNSTIQGITPNDAWWGAAVFHKRTVLFSPGYDSYYEYNPNNGLWYDVSDNVLTTQLHSLLVTMDQKVFKKSSIRQHSNETYRHKVIASQRGWVENKTAFIEKRPRHAQVQNGVLDFTGGNITLQPFSPDFYSLHASPLAYDPDAKCPNFEALMNHLLAEDRDVIQRAAGQFLIGRNLAQKIFLFEGEGNSRKSTIANVFKLVLGRAAVTELRTKHLAERFELYRVYQKSLLIGSDVNFDFLQQEGAAVLKKLTGGDPLTAEGKNSNQGFEFTGNLNVLITSNSKLLLKVNTDAAAWSRRLVLIPFPPAPAQAPKFDYWETLYKEEGAGILRWMVEGANRLLQDHDAGLEFILTTEQKERVKARIEESDGVSVFLQEHIEQADTGSDEGITTTELIRRFGDYCTHRGWTQPSFQMVAKTLAELLTQQYHADVSNRIRTQTGSNPLAIARGYTGIRWKNTPSAGTGNGNGSDVGSLANRIRAVHPVEPHD